MSIEKRLHGTLSDNREVFAYTLKNKKGMTAELSEFGGTLLRLLSADREGRFSDVVCGYDSLDDYVGADGYQGAVIGRFGNRIAGGAFALDGVDYTLARNNGHNHLHGGEVGFSHRLWRSQARETGGGPLLVLEYTSPDGEEGYPGRLEVRVEYALTDDDALVISYFARSDKKTIINLTNHSYFNLGGYASGSVHSHVLKLDAESYLPTDAGMIPTGEIKSVEGTPFDFRSPKAIGRDIGSGHPDLVTAGGYDHCFNFTGKDAGGVILRGELYSPVSGRVMEIFTDRPSVQLYTANFMNNPDFPLKGGLPQRPQTALCLETQGMPDSVNRPGQGFTDCTLSPGEVFKSTTAYRFGVGK